MPIKVPPLHHAHRQVWTPANLQGLHVWWDARRIFGVAEAGAISQWDDISGNARHFVQGTAGLQPTFRNAVQNGNPVTRWATDGMDAAFTTVAQPLTIMFVAKQSVDATAAFFDSVATNVCSCYRSGASWVMDAGGAVAIATADTTSYHVFTCIFNGASSIGGIDGTENTVNPSTKALTSGLRLGQVRDAGGFTLTGDICEGFMVPRVLSVEERLRSRQYFGKGWGITVT